MKQWCALYVFLFSYSYDNNFACNYIELKWPTFLNTTSAKFDWCDIKMADVMSFNSGHFGWCDREKFRKRCNYKNKLGILELYGLFSRSI